MAFPIFDKVGGTEAALALIAASDGGKSPTKFVQDKWRIKRRLPAKTHLPLINACVRLGVLWSVKDFSWRDEA